MDEEISVTNIPIERRLQTRYPVHTHVHIKQQGRDQVSCYAVNVSAGGVGIRTENLGLRIGSTCQLSFVIKLGSIIKIHRRKAVVKYVRNGITGFHMEPYKGN